MSTCYFYVEIDFLMFQIIFLAISKIFRIHRNNRIAQVNNVVVLRSTITLVTTSHFLMDRGWARLHRTLCRPYKYQCYEWILLGMVVVVTV
ncbi:hypothetical protein QVD17_21657 [Tagetes erecta]|uniref:Uncharacterized protein n=1 Tax=Tagetes erecta TaxID=13708 RepID=A0AAD8KC66_TARER|nr:hypothetical protein QVD17_21657 [Tagetes erecta]